MRSFLFIFAIWLTSALAPAFGPAIGPAFAQSPMTAAEFEAYTNGKTLYFNNQGETYGAERYFNKRRVEWSFLDGVCQQGRWFEAGRDYICFVYEDTVDPQCWQFFKTPDGLRAQFKSASGETEQDTLYEAQPNAAPMQCHGPGVGV